MDRHGLAVDLGSENYWYRLIAFRPIKLRFERIVAVGSLTFGSARPMAHALNTILVFLISCVGILLFLVFLGFCVDATIGRLLGLPRVFRHRGSGAATVIGEFGAMILIGVMVAEPFWREHIGTHWLVIIVLVGFVMGFIGQGEAQASASSG